MVRFLPENYRQGLIPRVISAAVLAPPVIVAIWLGSPWYDILILGIAGLMLWEWVRMCPGKRPGRDGLIAGIGVPVSIALMYLEGVTISILMAVGVAVLSGLAAPQRYRGILIAAGGLLTAIFAIVFLWLRSVPDDGAFMVLWLLTTVWVTDAGAYICGKIIGGPRLAPAISPGKTWAGFAGGFLFAMLWSCFLLAVLPSLEAPTVLAGCFVVALLAQVGDLGVSVAKRRSGIKDSGNLIPGHGGILDRSDSMLLTGPAVALFVVYRGW